MNEDVGKTVVLWDCVSLLEEFKKKKITEDKKCANQDEH